MRKTSWLQPRSFLLPLALLLSLGTRIGATHKERTVARSLQNIPAEKVNRIFKSASAKAEFSIPAGTLYRGTEVGGISGIAYDGGSDVFYLLSDDTTRPRFYTATINTNDRTPSADTVRFTGVTYLKDSDNVEFGPDTMYPESITYGNDGFIYIASYGNEGLGISPGVYRFNKVGRMRPAAFTLPSFYGYTGVGIKSVAMQPDTTSIWTTTDDSLLEDGPYADSTTGAYVRLTQIDRISRTSGAQYVYLTDPVPREPNPAGGNSNLKVEDLIALDDNGAFMVLETGYAEGEGYDVRIYYGLCLDSLDVQSQTTLADSSGAQLGIDQLVLKSRIADLRADMGIVPLDIQGMTLKFTGDRRGSSSGSRSSSYSPSEDTYELVMVSDNEFSNTTSTQFVILDLEIDTTVGVAEAAGETWDTINANSVAADELAGVADDPAVWVSQIDPYESLVIGALRSGGLGLFNLDGTLGEAIIPSQETFTNVDIIYSFPLDSGELVDLVVVTDIDFDTLVIFQVDPFLRTLTDVTSSDMAQPIFSGSIEGFDGALALATYTSPYTCNQYVFVSRDIDNEVAQIQLYDDGTGFVAGVVVRTLLMPVAPGFSFIDCPAKSLVVDREIGFLYAAVNNTGLVKFDAEPDERVGNNYTIVDEEITNFNGLTIYYSGDFTGYLIAANQFGSTFEVYEREYNNAYVGAFTVGGNYEAGVDRVDLTEGITVLNVYLGPEFPCGLFVAQDFDNTPSQVVNVGGTLTNINSNFKLVPYDEIADAVYGGLTLDTHTYGPRRFALAVLVDSLAQEVYCSLALGFLSPRDAEELLYLLDDASWELYEYGTKKRLLLEGPSDRRGHRYTGMSRDSRSGSKKRFRPFYRRLDEGDNKEARRGGVKGSTRGGRSSRKVETGPIGEEGGILGNVHSPPEMGRELSGKSSGYSSKSRGCRDGSSKSGSYVGGRSYVVARRLRRFQDLVAELLILDRIWSPDPVTVAAVWILSAQAVRDDLPNDIYY